MFSRTSGLLAFRRASLVVVARFASAMAGFVVLWLASRRIEYEEVGNIALGLSLATFLALVARGGLDNVVVREVAGGRIKAMDQRVQVLRLFTRVAIRSFFVTSLAILIILSFFELAWWDGSRTLMVGLLILSVPAQSILILIGNWIRASGRPLQAVSLQWLAPWIVAIIIIILLPLQFPSSMLSGAISASFFVAVIAAALLLNWHLPSSSRESLVAPPLGTDPIKKWQINWQLLTSASMKQGAMLLPLIVLSLVAAEQVVSSFALIIRLFSIVTMVQVSTNLLAAPELAFALSEAKKPKVESIARSWSLVTIFLGLPVLTTLAVSGNWILVAFGSAEGIGKSVLVTFTLGYIISIITGSVGQLMLMAHMDKQVLVIDSFSLVSTLLILIWVFVTASELGAALALATALTVQNIGYFLFVVFRMDFVPVPWLPRKGESTEIKLGFT